MEVVWDVWNFGFIGIYDGGGMDLFRSLETGEVK